MPGRREKKRSGQGLLSLIQSIHRLRNKVTSVRIPKLELRYQGNNLIEHACCFLTVWCFAIIEEDLQSHEERYALTQIQGNNNNSPTVRPIHPMSGRVWGWQLIVSLISSTTTMLVYRLIIEIVVKSHAKHVNTNNLERVKHSHTFLTTNSSLNIKLVRTHVKSITDAHRLERRRKVRKCQTW